jgi:hypothetical protein
MSAPTEKHRFSGYIEPELAKKIQEMADNEKRSFNQTTEILLQYAIKEKTRLKLKTRTRGTNAEGNS